MAKKTRPKGTGSGEGGFKRRLVAKDEKLLSLTLADFSTIMFSGDMVVQNFFQTVLPVEQPEGEHVDVALVARVAYSPEFFKALMSLTVRQYVSFEDSRNNKDEAVKWLKQLLKQIENGGSTQSPEPSTLQ